MAKAPKDNSDWTSLPVLTDIVGDAPPGIPTLTEEARSKHKLAQDVAQDVARNNAQKLAQHAEVLEMSAEEIAALLAPQLELLLRERMRTQFEILWQETWLQARASLPELIHAQLSGIDRSKAPAVDIIAPATPAIKKPAASKAKTGTKVSKNK